MKRKMVIGVLLAVAAVLCVRDSSAGDKEKIKPTVTFARTWDGAIAEALALNLPLVVHSHGWY